MSVTFYPERTRLPAGREELDQRTQIAPPPASRSQASKGNPSAVVKSTKEAKDAGEASATLSTWDELSDKQPNESVPALYSKLAMEREALIQSKERALSGQLRSALEIINMKERLAWIDYQKGENSGDADAMNKLNNFSTEVYNHLQDIFTGLSNPPRAAQNPTNLSDVDSQVDAVYRRYFSQNPNINPTDTVETISFGNVRMIDALLYFDDNTGGLFGILAPEDKNKRSAYNAALNSPALKTLRHELNLINKQQLGNDTFLPKNSFLIDFVDAELQHLNPEIHPDTLFRGYQESKNFNHNKLNLEKNGILKEVSPNDTQLKAFKVELNRQLSGEPEASLNDNSRFSQVYVSATDLSDFSYITSAFGNPETIPLDGVYSYRSDDGAIILYNPTPPQGHGKLFDITRPVPQLGTQEFFKDNSTDRDVFDFLEGRVGYVYDNVIIVPASVSVSAESIARNNERVIFSDATDDLEKIIALDLEQPYSKYIDSIIDDEYTTIYNNIDKVLDGMPNFEVLSPALSLNEDDKFEIDRILSDFDNDVKPREFLQGVIPGITISNPDVLYFPSGPNQKFSGLMVNLAREEIVPIPKSLKERARLFSTDEFRQNFSQNDTIKNRDRIRLDLQANDMKEALGDYFRNLQDLSVTYKKVQSKYFGQQISSQNDLQRNLDKEARKVVNYMDAVASGFITPSDEDLNTIQKIDDLLRRNDASYDAFAGGEERVSTMERITTKDNNPIVEDWRARLKADGDYMLTSGSEEWWRDNIERVRLAAEAVAVGIGAALAATGLGIPAALVANTIVAFAIDYSGDAVLDHHTDDLRTKNALDEDMAERLVKSLAKAAITTVGSGGTNAATSLSAAVAPPQAISLARLEQVLGGAFTKMTAAEATRVPAPQLAQSLLWQVPTPLSDSIVTLGKNVIAKGSRSRYANFIYQTMGRQAVSKTKA
ncbi:hypothetical protein [Ensifer sp. SL37]|uniref:hypothetical protein n=1 Tax=Ensifer sp. SL37 TaxID=2995137 RepID=UPI002272C2D7|nr:hypothetical protein [Ensifer sp. SL37]MCY1740765.1 hypothetical protein [Ensifer sp. SL37]